VPWVDGGLGVQAAQTSFAGKRVVAPAAAVPRPSLGSRLVVRAEDTKVAKVRADPSSAVRRDTGNECFLMIQGNASICTLRLYQCACL
jgi:hypothetical protein